MKQTTSLCPTCYRAVPASVTVDGGLVWLEKICPDHGPERVLVEVSPYFYSEVMAPSAPDAFRQHVAVTLLDVTNRCNVQCPHCYHMPGRTPDSPRAEIVTQALSCIKADRGFVLMGAEPTMRKDLPALVKDLREATGKLVTVYTNGVKLASPRYVSALKEADLTAFAFSLHTPDYLESAPLWRAKLAALRNILAAGMVIDHIAVSLRSLDALPEALAAISVLGRHCNYVRLRSPSRIGICADRPFFLSDFYMAVATCCKSLKLSFGLSEADNGAYHVMVLIEGVLVRLIRWPDVHEVDLGELDCPPYALFVPEIGETNFVHQALLQEAIKLGRLDRATLRAS